MTPLEFELQLTETESDDERLLSLTNLLRRDLYELGAESVERPLPQETPEGTKGEPFSIGALAVVAIPAVLPALVSFLQSWSLRGENRRVRIKTGGVEVEFTSDKKYSPEEIFALVQQLETQGESTSPSPKLENQVFVEQEGKRDVLRILFLAANPKDTTALGLDEEIRTIDRELRRSELRDRFELEQQWAVRISDLQDHLLRYQPEIVHFSGHGSRAGELLLEDQNGYMKPVSVHALDQLFRALKDDIRCVVLNACFSAVQAEAIGERIDCVVGMSTAIGDQAAIQFAAAFYRALGYGRSLGTAFDLGVNQIDLEDLDEQDTPQLICPRGDPYEIYLTRT